MLANITPGETSTEIPYRHLRRASDFFDLRWLNAMAHHEEIHFQK